MVPPGDWLVLAGPAALCNSLAFRGMIELYRVWKLWWMERPALALSLSPPPPPSRSPSLSFLSDSPSLFLSPSFTPSLPQSLLHHSERAFTGQSGTQRLENGEWNAPPPPPPPPTLLPLCANSGSQRGWTNLSRDSLTYAFWQGIEPARNLWVLSCLVFEVYRYQEAQWLDLPPFGSGLPHFGVWSAFVWV